MERNESWLIAYKIAKNQPRSVKFGNLVEISKIGLSNITKIFRIFGSEFQKL